MNEKNNDRCDLANINLTYDKFRDLAKNNKLTANEKIGFPDSYRKGLEKYILEDLLSKLTNFKKNNQSVLDIGPGCGDLPKLLINLCKQQNHTLVFNDSEEMLSFHEDQDNLYKVPGMFPGSYKSICAVQEKYDVILCYSVFHYIFVETNVWNFLDKCLMLLKPGGQLLIGDIPNISKRKRFFSSEAGINYHHEFMKTKNNPEVLYNKIEEQKIDDAILLSLIMRAQISGFDAYILPQGQKLPMYNRRDDILIMRP